MENWYGLDIAGTFIESKKIKIIFSFRGNENAFRCCVEQASRSQGVILVNTTGFRIHKGIRPNWVIQVIGYHMGQ